MTLISVFLELFLIIYRSRYSCRTLNVVIMSFDVLQTFNLLIIAYYEMLHSKSNNYDKRKNAIILYDF